MDKSIEDAIRRILAILKEVEDSGGRTEYVFCGFGDGEGITAYYCGQCGAKKDGGGTCWGCYDSVYDVDW